MRNAGIASVSLYIAAHYILTPHYGAAGIWMAFLVFYIMRAVTLSLYYRGITQGMAAP